ncbi:four helix bundle protein [Aerosakkonemataceae cyanobacterium BLCC-F50]|uniref:Four helix bundle protein n=1 Tax=Floridaenema flaviceps BLCC-F50 TaxID=3153642 RepID=A0ABV4XNJ4_9CYAN
MGKPEFERLPVYQVSEKLANEIWRLVQDWNDFDKDSLGKQIIISADCIGANIAAGTVQEQQDNQQLVRQARGCLYETIHALRLAWNRKLITQEQASKIKPIIDELSSKLSAYLKSLGS